MEHAGGLLAQTLPAFEVGAGIKIEKFNAFNFCKKIRNFTHTHITPDHGKAISLTKSFKSLDLNGIWVTCGSEPVQWDLICLLYTSPSPRDTTASRMPSSA